MAFKDTAEVYSPEECCQFSTYIVRYIHPWHQQLKLDSDLDLVHWNCGLWDCLIMPDGLPCVKIDAYAENIERICNIY